MKSTRAAQSGGQIRLTSDPVFCGVLSEAQEILASQAGRRVPISALALPALQYAEDLSEFELLDRADKLDLTKEAFGGAARLNEAARTALDRLYAQTEFARPRKDSRAAGVWSRRALLVVAIYAYCQHVVAANR
ncbi:MAG: hypothetical protein B7Y99_02550 [Caulobacterales bacterium 32-69-10]|nr:MAG: hypothetical protein B7Y99_02550 [Caulobacterales bacterium 32-69-10]